ncbi:histidine ABC transporter substrate-binding protein [Pseudovibrio japonicus]|uniref:Histidine ABC transporter substrate-binding protein n=1 Tax=Pseudovibrio japonicus TaxID=366534 RepID=A0ABQ3EMF0_9HYPH|nr:ABC transporter substrate-binding protein [Pseudovibrio japonicus]GHB46891.1 histidine ABC transporter substrate-binding protein [Pseudovibrio japonicus]
MLIVRNSVIGLAFTLPFYASQSLAAEPACDLDRPLVFAGLDWDSSAFHTSVAQFILENGYGCSTDIIPGSNIPLMTGLVRGDIDVAMEVWPSNLPDVLIEGEEEDKVVNLGVNYPDTVQAWYVPKYVVEGENAPAPDLKSVADLAQYKEIFADPEEPDKGRFLNCIFGWVCEITNTKKLHAYGLADDFVNFRPGSGSAIAAAVESSLQRKRPIFFYYWGPSWLLGKYQDDLVVLEEPAYDPVIWDQLLETTNADDVTEAVAYPSSAVDIYANAEFVQEAPELVDFFRKYHTTAALTSQGLAYINETGGSADDAAIEFLKTHQDLWQTWVSPEVAERVEAALGRNG